MKKLNFKVNGMTCSSCEVIIERNLRKVSGVEKVKASKSKDSVDVECSDQVQVSELQAAVKDSGYNLSLQESGNHGLGNHDSIPQNWFSKHKERFSEIGAVLVVMFGIFFLLRQFDILPKGLAVTDNMSYGFIFIIGLVAATSTCLAVSGGLLLAIAAKYNEKHPHLNGWQKFKPHVFFNIGRIVSYTLLGGAIGALGSVLTISSKAAGVITIIASLLMIIMGLQLLGIFPWLNKIKIKLPKFIAHKVYDSSDNNSSGKTSSFLFGAATFLLPCGFTQALQLYVLGKGSFVIGALTMLAFSLGTLPSLASIGAFTSFTKGNIQRYFMTFSAILIIILGVMNLSPGFNLTGAVIALPSGNGNVDVVDTAPIIDGKQVVNMAVNGFDYSPDTFTLKKGVPVEWRIDGKGAQGCAKIISVPALGITEQLSSGVKIVEFTPQKTGKIKFSCGMGMAGPGFFEVIA